MGGCDRMKFKTSKISTQFGWCDVRLRHILYALDSFTNTNFGIEITITSLFRDEEGSTHSTSPVRAGDVRMSVFSHGETIEIEEFMSTYIYDESRPHLKSYRVHANRNAPGVHLHVQVNYNGFTKMI
jgi:hypothetical protein